jgi:hypothetical protein
MKALLLFLISFSALGQDRVLILPTPNPYQPRTTVTITPDGTYHTFQNRNSSTTIGPEGTYQTFQSRGTTTTFTPDGKVITTFTAPSPR